MHNKAQNIFFKNKKISSTLVKLLSLPHSCGTFCDVLLFEQHLYLISLIIFYFCFEYCTPHSDKNTYVLCYLKAILFSIIQKF